MKQLPMGVQTLENFAKENEKLSNKMMDYLRGGDGTNNPVGTGSDGGDDVAEGGSW